LSGGETGGHQSLEEKRNQLCVRKVPGLQDQAVKRIPQKKRFQDQVGKEKDQAIKTKKIAQIKDSRIKRRIRRSSQELSMKRTKMGGRCFWFLFGNVDVALGIFVPPPKECHGCARSGMSGEKSGGHRPLEEKKKLVALEKDSRARWKS
jgi:hypothetical protein